MERTQNKIMTTHEIADRFNELAREGKWFDIQEELFSDNIRSIDPEGSPYMGYAEGKAAVRKKGMDFVSKITAVHSDNFTAPFVTGNYFAIGRELDLTTSDHGRVQLNELMVYQVKDGKIILEQFIY